MIDGSEDSSEIELKLSEYNIVVINYLSDSDKPILLNNLRKLYGDKEPFETSIDAGIGFYFPYGTAIRKNIVYYDDSMVLTVPLPSQFESMEIRLFTSFRGLNHVICNAKLHSKIVLSAREQFKAEIAKNHHIHTPQILEDAHVDRQR